MIDDDALRRAFADLRARLVHLEIASGLFVAEKELDTPKGNPIVRFKPRDWRGEDFKGKRFSECSPDFLETLAGTLSWMAAHPQAGKERYAEGNRREAAIARSWARRLLASGWALAAAAPKPERPAGRPSGGRPRAGRPRRGGVQTSGPGERSLPERCEGSTPSGPSRFATAPAGGGSEEPAPLPGDSEPSVDHDFFRDLDDLDRGDSDDDFFDQGGLQRETRDGMD